ncbi:hypothetical protein [Streptomyces anulatus]|uniref:hypothetical protein n=1 Tax=Streptomyces anulatus TaxID=1892 RepID=UPI0036789384
MAARGTAAHRNPGNPLGGILRDLNRKARTSTTGSVQGGRRPGPPGERGERGERGPAGKPGQPGTVVLAAVVTTAEDGRASWTYGPELAASPVLGALAVDSGQGGTTVTVTAEEVTATHAVVRVWRSRPLLGLGLLPSVPVGAGVEVHMTATPATVADTLS